MSILLSGELEVDGNLKVTGTIEGTIKNDSLAQVIANLQAQITALQFQITQMGCINNGIIPEGYCDCDFNVFDACGECGGDALSEEDCIDYVLSFDGIDDYIDFPEIIAGYFYTLECEVRLGESTGTDLYAIISNTGINELGVWHNDVISIHRGGANMSGGQVARYVWTSVKLNRNNDEHTLYLNNSFVVQQNFNWPEDAYDTIGAWIPNDSALGNREPWSGEMASLLIYDVSNDTLIYYKFNSGIGDTLYDYSGNGNHGTIHGATWVERD